MLRNQARKLSMPKFGKKSRANLKGVNTKIVNVLNQSIKHFDFSIIEGLRSVETQKSYVAKGASKTMKSKHLEGKAVDIAPYPIDYDDIERFVYLGGFILGVASQLGVKLRWGLDWDRDTYTKDTGFRDIGHFELIE
jgi:peptidoglycan L-alanyl-D-glutamate endopeptidase CwlK